MVSPPPPRLALFPGSMKLLKTGAHQPIALFYFNLQAGWVDWPAVGQLLLDLIPALVHLVITFHPDNCCFRFLIGELDYSFCVSLCQHYATLHYA